MWGTGAGCLQSTGVRSVLGPCMEHHDRACMGDLACTCRGPHPGTGAERWGAWAAVGAVLGAAVGLAPVAGPGAPAGPPCHDFGAVCCTAGAGRAAAPFHEAACLART